MLAFVVILWYHFGTEVIIKASDISEFITYYEPVWLISVMYPQILNGPTYPIQIEFYSFNKTFTLSVIQGRSAVVSPDAQIELHGGENDTVVRLSAHSFLSRMIEGRLVDEPSSDVQGTFYDGVLDVVIRTADTTYYIESADKYFEKNVQFKSIMYRSSDVDIGDLFCPVTFGGKPCKPYRKSYILGPLVNESLPIRRTFKTKVMELKHIKPSSTNEQNKYHKVPPPVTRPNVVCLLKLVADHRYFQTVGKNNFRTTTEEMVRLVRLTSDIYFNTTFPVGGKNVSGIVSLQVKNVFIHKSQHEPNYRFYDEKLPAEAFLQKLAEYNFDGFCLGVGFTFRSFKKRVLGLAYLADPSSVGTLGGICQERKYLPFRDKTMSYNAAFVTVGSHGRVLPKTVSVLSLAHEIGHSFGAHHDPENNIRCNPGSNAAYLMSPNAVTGKDRNNARFSPCSRREIGLVLDNKDKVKCFQPMLPVCGNGIAEDFEECDCGHAFQCKETDPCCTPMGGIGKDAECTYRRQQGKKCSPEKDACCTSDCQVVTADSKKLCIGVGKCHEESYCDGLTAQCPSSPYRKDWEPCMERTGVCQSGVCVQNVCSLKVGHPPCECSEPEFKCLKCCAVNTSSCRPAHELGIMALSGLSVVRGKGEHCESGTNKVCNTLGDCVDPFIGLRDVVRGHQTKTGETIISAEGLDTFSIVLILLVVGLIATICVCIICWIMPFRRPGSKKRCEDEDVCVIRHGES